MQRLPASRAKEDEQVLGAPEPAEQEGEAAPEPLAREKERGRDAPRCQRRYLHEDLLPQQALDEDSRLLRGSREREVEEESLRSCGA